MSKKSLVTSAAVLAIAGLIVKILGAFFRIPLTILSENGSPLILCPLTHAPMLSNPNPPRQSLCLFFAGQEATSEENTLEGY